MAAVQLSCPAVLTCSNQSGNGKKKRTRRVQSDGIFQGVNLKPSVASVCWARRTFTGSLVVKANLHQLQTLSRQGPHSTRGAGSPLRASAETAAGVGLEQSGASSAPSVITDTQTIDNDYPPDYVLVSNDPDDLQQEIKKIAAENEELRRKILESNAEAAEAGLLLRDTTLDVSRPRANIQAPSAKGVVVATTSAPTQSSSPRAPVADESATVYDGLQATKLARSDLEESNKRTTNPFNIVFVASEVAPYSKTGGLGDVCGSLPLALAARGHRVMVISPRYMNGVTDDNYAGAFDCQCRMKVACFGGQHEVAYFHEYRAGVDWVFVDHPSYHRPGSPYGDTRGAFGDNQFRFTLLCHAACEAPLVLPLGGFTYGDKCVFIANDWHAGLVPVLLAAKYRKHNVYLGSRSILAIHNLAHQGVEPGTTYSNLGLPPDWYGALEWVFPTWARKHALDKGEAVNTLKGLCLGDNHKRRWLGNGRTSSNSQCSYKWHHKRCRCR
eukprot:TRINITY_DN731_c0_g1_i1.p1 TRINITY_DN731_c0_g1~~TRINITY_DN731_c0_g1_i1.p1  ORF type:complete len:498 (+),score=77.34 TRINITY_DN731_c0_g1_i1:225-1718(+)